jgi:hypothetical protein
MLNFFLIFHKILAENTILIQAKCKDGRIREQLYPKKEIPPKNQSVMEFPPIQIHLLCNPDKYSEDPYTPLRNLNKSEAIQKCFVSEEFFDFILQSGQKFNFLEIFTEFLKENDGKENSENEKNENLFTFSFASTIYDKALSISSLDFSFFEDQKLKKVDRNNNLVEKNNNLLDINLVRLCKEYFQSKSQIDYNFDEFQLFYTILNEKSKKLTKNFKFFELHLKNKSSCNLSDFKTFLKRLNMTNLKNPKIVEEFDFLINLIDFIPKMGEPAQGDLIKFDESPNPNTSDANLIIKNSNESNDLNCRDDIDTNTLFRDVDAIAFVNDCQTTSNSIASPFLSFLENISILSSNFFRYEFDSTPKILFSKFSFLLKILIFHMEKKNFLANNSDLISHSVELNLLLIKLSILFKTEHKNFMKIYRDQYRLIFFQFQEIQQKIDKNYAIIRFSIAFSFLRTLNGLMNLICNFLGENLIFYDLNYFEIENFGEILEKKSEKFNFKELISAILILGQLPITYTYQQD